MAGLACARELKSRGYRVLVVEARGRPGGRLKGGAVKVSAPVPVPPSSGVSQRASSTAGRRKTKPRPPAEQEQQQLVDLGGALIHGVDDNPVAALAEDMGVETQPVQECLLFQNGWPIDPRYDARISAVFNDCLEETFERCNTRPDNGTSFGELFSEVCVERSVNASSPIFLWHKANLEVSCGASFEELGWQWNEDEPYGYDGDHLAVRNSWKAVVDGLAEDLDVLYDSPVSRVHVVHPEPQPNERVPVSSPSSPRKVASTANKPVTARAKRKFVSAAYSSLASPSLPARKSRRVMHVDADARRSSRANLGQVVERYTDARPPERTGDKKRRPANPSSAKQRHEGNKPPLRPKKQTVVQIVLQNGRVLEADYVGTSEPALPRSHVANLNPHRLCLPFCPHSSVFH
jgi:lysine-specific histone demethylase 1